jgi:hypothetical protein
VLLMAASMSGGGKLDAYLAKMAKQLDKQQTLRVGFLETAKYPDADHTQVAQVAAWLNFGSKTAPPRPFFTDMVAAKSPAWGDKLCKLIQINDGDIALSLGQVGEGIKGQLESALINLNSPPLSKITLMLRRMKADDPHLNVTGATVGEAARRVADGESPGDVSTKVGVVTKHMLKSIGSDIQT